jgi:hypothetical protein
MPSVLGIKGKSPLVYPTPGGGGGSSAVIAPFSATFYVDGGTLVPLLSQNGSTATPFKTITQALAAAVAAGLTEVAIRLCSLDFTTENVVLPPTLEDIVFTAEGLAEILSVTTAALPGQAVVYENVVVLTQHMTASTTLTTLSAAQLGAVVLEDGAGIQMKDLCLIQGSVTVTAPGNAGSVLLGNPDAPQSSNSSASLSGAFNAPKFNLFLFGASVTGEAAIECDTLTWTHCHADVTGGVIAHGRATFDKDIIIASAPCTLQLLSGAGGSFTDCDFSGAGANLTIDNTLCTVSFDLYSWQNFLDSGCILTTPVNVAIVGRGYRAGIALGIPAMAPASTLTISYAVGGAKVGDAVVLNVQFGTDIWVASILVTGPDLVSVTYKTNAGSPGENPTGLFAVFL